MKDYQTHSSHKHIDNECYTSSPKEGTCFAFQYGEKEWQKNRHSEHVKLFYEMDVVSNLEKKFNELALRWKKETGAYSTTLHKAGNDNYLEIIGLGREVVPYILKLLKKNPDHWFVALKAITGDNPVPKEHIGNIQKMREDWLEWGIKKGVIES